MAKLVKLYRSDGSSFNEEYYVATDWSIINNKPTNFTPAAHTHTKAQINGLQDALNNKLNLSGGTVGPLTSRYYYQSTNGEPSVNLGNPTIAEMVFEEQFDNKLAFYPPNNISIEVFDGSTWDTLETVTELQKKRLVGGDAYAGIQIPSGVNQFRITIRNKNSYVYLNTLYAYMLTQGNYVAIEIWIKRDDGGWIQHTSSPKTVSGWPGHIYLPFNNIAFSLQSTDNHYNEIRILFKPIWNNSNYIALDKLQLWGGYPAGKRRLYSIDENKNAYFPATVYSNNKALVTTDDSRLSDARPASDVPAWAKKPSLDLDDIPTIPHTKLSGVINYQNLNAILSDYRTADVADATYATKSELNNRVPVEIKETTYSCNSLITPGFYTIPGGNVGITHAPVNDSFSIIVSRTASPAYGTYIHQLAMQNSTHNVYVRYYNDGTWSEWRKLLYADEKAYDTTRVDGREVRYYTQSQFASITPVAGVHYVVYEN